MQRVGSLLILLMALAGCGQSTPSHSHSSTPTTEPTLTHESTTTGQPPQNRTMPLVAMYGTECTGLKIALEGPSAVYRGRPVADWPENSASPMNQMNLQVFKCERLAWGPFERGPVFMVQEWQGNFDDPPSCYANSNVGGRTALESIWFSDPEIAKYARDEYHMNAYAATFTLDLKTIGTANEYDWGWVNGSGMPSQVTFHDPQHGFNVNDTDVERVYWGNGVGISYLDFSYTYLHSRIGELEAEGSLPSPMMYGRYGPPEFATALDNIELQAAVGGPIQAFRDSQCKEPL